MLAAVVYRSGMRFLSSPAMLVVGAVAVYSWLWAFNAWIGGYYGDTTGTSPAWIISPVIEALAWAVFALAYISQKWKMPGQLDRTLSFLGSVSFSMYAWHLPVLALMARYPYMLPFEHWYLNFALVIMPIITAASALSYFVIERPFMELRSVYVKPKVTAAPRAMDIDQAVSVRSAQR
jgi:peptidoglycan/LPS O-acetylase OafA/YrhL